MENTGSPANTLKRILVIDDDLMNRKLLEHCLKPDGWEVCVASNGPEGIAMFTQQPPAVVITDQTMPEMSGEEVAAELKKISPSVPVILLTGHGDAFERGDTNAGVDLIAAKPVTRDKLRAAIAKVLPPADSQPA